jgi:hypothetical protein
LADAGAQRTADHSGAEVAALLHRLVDQHARPRLSDAEQAAGERVAEADFRLLDDIGGKVAELQPRREGGERRRLARLADVADRDVHGSSAPGLLEGVRWLSITGEQRWSHAHWTGFATRQLRPTVAAGFRRALI